MDLTKIIQDLFTGNSGIILLVAALFLFKDQILAFFNRPPVLPPVVPPPVVIPVPGPDPAPIVIPADHPLVDIFIKQVLPVILPLLINSLKQEPPK